MHFLVAYLLLYKISNMTFFFVLMKIFYRFLFVDVVDIAYGRKEGAPRE